FALPAALLLGLALVMQLLAARKRQLDFGAPLFVEIELERNERHALALDRSGKLVDLTAMQQQLALAFGRMIEAAALQVFRDVGIDQPNFPAAGIGIGFGDRRLALAQRFHLRSEEHTSELQSLRHLVCRLLLEKKK